MRKLSHTITIAAVVVAGYVLSHHAAHQVMQATDQQTAEMQGQHSQQIKAPNKRLMHSCGFIELIINPHWCGIHPQVSGK